MHVRTIRSRILTPASRASGQCHWTTACGARRRPCTYFRAHRHRFCELLVGQPRFGRRPCPCRFSLGVGRTKNAEGDTCPTWGVASNVRAPGTSAAFDARCLGHRSRGLSGPSQMPCMMDGVGLFSRALPCAGAAEPALWCSVAHSNFPTRCARGQEDAPTRP